MWQQPWLPSQPRRAKALAFLERCQEQAKGSKREPVLTSHPGLLTGSRNTLSAPNKSWPWKRPRKEGFLSPFHLPCSAHPPVPASCWSCFLFPEHFSPMHSCLFLISSLYLQYFFLPESSWQTPTRPSKLTSILWHSLALPVLLHSWTILHHPLLCDVWWQGR